MFKKTLLINLELFGLQLVAFVFSFYFLIGVIPPWLYSLFTGFLFVWALHATFWQMGNKDYKMNIIKNNNLKENEAPHKIFWFKGAAVALPHLIINIIFVIISSGVETGNLITIQRFALFPFIGILNLLETDLRWGYFFANLAGCFLMYLPCVLGYISGAKNLSLIEKIVPKIIYKSPEKSKEENNNKTK